MATTPETNRLSGTLPLNEWTMVKIHDETDGTVWTLWCCDYATASRIVDIFDSHHRFYARVEH